MTGRRLVVGIVLAAAVVGGGAGSASPSPNSCEHAAGPEGCGWLTSLRHAVYCLYDQPPAGDRFECFSTVSGYAVTIGPGSRVSVAHDPRSLGYRRPARMVAGAYAWSDDRPFEAFVLCGASRTFFACDIGGEWRLWFKSDGSFALLSVVHEDYQAHRHLEYYRFF